MRVALTLAQVVLITSCTSMGKIWSDKPEYIEVEGHGEKVEAMLQDSDVTYFCKEVFTANDRSKVCYIEKNDQKPMAGIGDKLFETPKAVVIDAKNIITVAGKITFGAFMILCSNHQCEGD